jgi:hypothetical protein
MLAHRLLVMGYNQAAFSFGPEQNLRVGRPERQVRGIADANHVEGVDPKCVVLLNGLPKPTAPEMLVQQIAQRHRSHRPRLLLSLESLQFLHCAESSPIAIALVFLIRLLDPVHQLSHSDHARPRRQGLLPG